MFVTTNQPILKSLCWGNWVPESYMIYPYPWQGENQEPRPDFLNCQPRALSSKLYSSILWFHTFSLLLLLNQIWCRNSRCETDRSRTFLDEVYPTPSHLIPWGYLGHLWVTLTAQRRIVWQQLCSLMAPCSKLTIRTMCCVRLEEGCNGLNPEPAWEGKYIPHTGLRWDVLFDKKHFLNPLRLNWLKKGSVKWAYMSSYKSYNCVSRIVYSRDKGNISWKDMFGSSVMYPLSLLPLFLEKKILSPASLIFPFNSMR